MRKLRRSQELSRGERGPHGDHGQTGDTGATGKTGAAGKDAPIHPWRWRALTVWIIVFSAIVFVGMRQLRDQASEIQQQRAENIHRTCVSTNDRHDNAIHELDRIYEQALKGETDQKRIDQLQASKVNSVLLIQALSPKQDCDRLVQLGTDPDGTG